MRTGTTDQQQAGPSASASTNAAAAEARVTEARLIAVVEDVAKTIHSRRAARLEVRLDSDLDRDIGLDSLSGAELMQRLDQEFGIRLPVSTWRLFRRRPDVLPCGADGHSRNAHDPLGRSVVPSTWPDRGSHRPGGALIQAMISGQTWA
jgi:acyl carrier protein